MGRSYTNFDLVIEPAGDKYRARVISSPAGQAAVEFDSLFSPLELENFVLRMGRPQRGMRRIESPEMETIKAFGGRLFETVFKDEVYACYRRSMDHVLDQGRGLRIRLRINVPQFHDLPWEYLYNPNLNQFLALSKDTPVVRYIELSYGTQALPVKVPLNVLVMISSPADYPPLRVDEEWERLQRALQPLINSGMVALKKLETASLSALQQELRRQEVHIFHYIGHGRYFERQQEGMLLLEDENHRGRPTNGQQLGAILHDHHTLRLVVLNACEAGRTSAEDPYTGVAQTLVQQGVPAVLAMQFEIFENAAITLAQEFYGAIADGYPVDAALAEARKAIFAENNYVEWGTPVLFMRVPNGVLFKQQKTGESKPVEEKLAAERAARQKAEREAAQKQAEEQRIGSLLAEANDSMNGGEWSNAIPVLQRLLTFVPDHPEAKRLLEKAETKIKQEQEALRRQAQLAKLAEAEQERANQIVSLLAEAKQKMRETDCSGAVEALQKLLMLAPNHREAKELLGKARHQLKQEQEARERQAQLIELYEQASTKIAARDWAGAIRLLENIERTDPVFQDTRHLLQLAHTQRECEEKFLSLVACGREQLEKREWTAATQSFQDAALLEPGNDEVQALLARAQEGAKAQALFDESQQGLLAGQIKESKATGTLSGRQTLREAGRQPGVAAPGRRRLALSLSGAAILILLVIGMYYVMGQRTDNAAPTARPTNGISAPMGGVLTEPVIEALSPIPPSQTPSPTAPPSQTPEPSPTATPEFYVYGAASQVTLYQGPDLRYGKVASYAKGEKFTVMAKSSSGLWLLCKASDGSEGWLYIKWIDSDLDLSIVPTASFIPPPPPTATKPPKDGAPPCTGFGC